MSELQKHVLDNGVKVLIEPFTHVKSAAIGLWCRSGSRHENNDEAGITHFIEHMLFKGTKRRSAAQIAQEIEGRGGILNAFTDKETTCYYCRVLSDDVGLATDVLTDMMTGSLLDPEELEREKGVVLEEIKRGEDEPSDHVHELHLGFRWGQHPLGKPVIGTSESVSSFTRDMLQSYLSRQYRAENVLLAVAGNVEPDAVLKLAQDQLGGIEIGASSTSLDEPRGRESKNEIAKKIEQVHFCIGADSCSLVVDDIYTAAVLDGALGSGMGSRLFQEIREKRGLAYSIGSYNLSYSAGGAFTVYGGTSMKHWPVVQELVRAELDKVMQDGLDAAELARVKRQISGGIVLALEGMSSRMMRIAKNELTHGRDIPIEETLEKINAVDNERLIQFAQDRLKTELINVTAIGPF